MVVALKLKSGRELGDAKAWGGDIAFIALLGFVGFSGLVLYALGSTAAMPALLALHLGAVLTFFLLTPFTKMTHGFYRLALLLAVEDKHRVYEIAGAELVFPAHAPFAGIGVTGHAEVSAADD